MRGGVRQNAAGSLELWLTIDVENTHGTLHPCEALIDTGFTGWLMLPEAVIQQLGLTTHDQTQAVLATGEIRSIHYCLTRVLWQGALQPVVLFQSRDQSLLGMQLLKGNVITIHAWEDGEITITEPMQDAGTP